MSFNMEKLLDPEAALRLFAIAAQERSGMDLLMTLTNKGTAIEGESVRGSERKDVGTKALDVMGYLLIGGAQIAPGTSEAKVSTSHLIVVRRCDAATASIASLLKSQSEDVKVNLVAFKAGGDSSDQPTMSIDIEKGRVAHFAVLTVGALGSIPCEIVAFAHQRLTIRSAPQAKTGQRGAERICNFNE